MQYRDVIDKVLPRAHRLGFVDAETGQVDAVEVEAALLGYLQRLVAHFDLDAFLIINENMATTTTDISTYTLPDDFGRLLQPNKRDEHGLFIHDGTNIHQLIYRKANEWLRLQASTANRPSHFTVTGRQLSLDPAPDANNGSNYTIRGTYSIDIRDIDLNDDLPIPLSTAEAGTLAEMAVDFQAAGAGLLIATSRDADSSLVNQQRRTRAPMQRRASWSRNRGIRR